MLNRYWVPRFHKLKAFDHVQSIDVRQGGNLGPLLFDISKIARDEKQTPLV